MKLTRYRAKPELGEERNKIGSQRDFVEVLKMEDPGMNINTYAKWEAGARRVRLDKARMIASALNQPLHKLFEK